MHNKKSIEQNKLLTTSTMALCLEGMGWLTGRRWWGNVMEYHDQKCCKRKKKSKIYKKWTTNQEEKGKKRTYRSLWIASDFQYSPKSFHFKLSTRPQWSPPMRQFCEPSRKGRGQQGGWWGHLFSRWILFIQITLFPFGYAFFGIHCNGNEVWIFLVWRANVISCIWVYFFSLHVTSLSVSLSLSFNI